MKVVIFFLVIAVILIPESSAVVNYNLFNKQTGIGYDITAETTLKLERNVPLKVIVHGFKMSSSSEGKWQTDMKNAIVNMEPRVYVLTVTWISESFEQDCLKPTGLPTYETDAKNTINVGKELGALIKKIADVTTTNVHCIGHSLGAHICAAASNNPGPKFNRISGLDPAGPYFMPYKNILLQDVAGLAWHLKPTDATFVDVYHTNDGRGRVVGLNDYWMPSIKFELGFTGILGTHDFIFNNGTYQPACDFVPCPKNIACSHKMAHQYYIASIKNGPNARCFTATKTGAPSIQAGYFNSQEVLNGNQQGVYQVLTTNAAPYCRA